MPAMKIGYARVSRDDQNPQYQHDALTAASCIQVGRLQKPRQVEFVLISVTRNEAEAIRCAASLDFSMSTSV
jgi:DNA invertase Pin-like site-specific DNA recombinase